MNDDTTLVTIVKDEKVECAFSSRYVLVENTGDVATITIGLNDQMPPSHAAERREFWRAVFLATPDLHIITASSLADTALAKYDERFTDV